MAEIKEQIALPCTNRNTTAKLLNQHFNAATLSFLHNMQSALSKTDPYHHLEFLITVQTNECWGFEFSWSSNKDYIKS